MTFKRQLFVLTFASLIVRLALWQYFHSHVLGLATFCLPDDALYYFGMARNLATGAGISFDGLHPSNGMHPLWLFVITPIFSLGLSKWAAIHVVLLFQSVLDTVVVWMIGLSIYRSLNTVVEGNRITAALISAAIYGFSSIVLLRGINGLETTLAALLFVIWFLTYLQVIERSGSFWWVVLGTVTGLLMLARTDSFIVLLPATIYLFVERFKRDWKGMLIALVIAVVFLAPWFIWNYRTFGTIVQSSAEAVPMLAMRKYDVIYGNAKYFHLSLDALKNILKPFWLSTFGLSIFTIGFRVVRAKKNLSDAEIGIYLLLAGGILLLAVHSLFRGFIREWYVVELLPLFLIGFGISIGMNAGKTSVRSIGRWSLPAIVILLQVWMYHSAQYPSQAAVLHVGVPEVERLTSFAKVATFNSGYYGYFSEHPDRVINIDGVVNSDALQALKKGDIHDYLLHDSVSYILDFQGDFGGYVNLFDRHLLDGFVRDSSFGNPNASNEELILYRRK